MMMMEIDTQLQIPPPLQNQLHRSNWCDRHPDQPVTGFCASCLRERLAGLEAQAAADEGSGGHRKSTSSIKSIFFRHPAGSSSSLELRRCKSFSGSRGPRPSAAAFEPQRKSCDVRGGRNTLWSLFHQDDTARLVVAHDHPSADIELDLAPQNPRFSSSSFTAPVLEAHEEEEDDNDDGDEIRPVADRPDPIEIEEEIQEEEDHLKDRIDLDDKPKNINGGGSSSFWLAASVFSKKLQNWRRKQKLKKQNNSSSNNNNTNTKPTPKSSRRFRGTQSEVAVDALGRRSCDVDPFRFSLDVGRMSIDEPRFSWDAPRASWDGHLIGARSLMLPPRPLPMEPTTTTTTTNIAPPPPAVVERWDGLIPVEEDSIVVPGGSIQTRDYYLDSSSSRRRSLDRSNSTKRLSFEFNAEPRRASSASVTELFRAQNGGKHDRDSREFSSNSLRDDYSESFESAFRDPHKGAPKKKSRRWSKAWSIWGLIYRRSSSRGGEGADNAVAGRSLSESWPELREQADSYNGKISRCNSSRSSLHNNAGLGSMRRSNGHGKKRQGEFVLERNRSARYSPTHVDNGMLRFYLTPMRNSASSSRRNGLSGKSSHGATPHSFTRTVLGMY